MRSETESFFGVILIIIGIIFGLYVGFYICLCGGIAQLVNGLKADPVSIVAIAIGMLRMIGTVPVGVFSAVLLILPGLHYLF